MNTATEESSGVRTQAVGERLHGKDKEFVVTEITSTGRVRITTATREAIAAAEAHPGYGIPREVHPGRQAPEGTIARRIADACNANGLHLGKLVEATDIPLHRLHNYLTGKKDDLTLPELRLLAAAAGLRIEVTLEAA